MGRISVVSLPREKTDTVFFPGGTPGQNSTGLQPCDRAAAQVTARHGLRRICAGSAGAPGPGALLGWVPGHVVTGQREAPRKYPASPLSVLDTSVGKDLKSQRFLPLPLPGCPQGLV